MSDRQDVYLIPGFFGFANLGELRYFAHVNRQLERQFDEAGVAIEVHYVPTLPTSSIRRRASRLLTVIDETAAPGDGPIHLVGHSTGGLDARLLMAPGVSLQNPIRVKPVTARVRSVVSVACPHHGTPLASVFNSVLGQQQLRLLSAATIHTIRLGSVPIPALLLLARMLSKVTSPMSRMRRVREGLIRRVLRDLLGDFRAERRDQLRSFFQDVGQDRSLLPQLTPDAVDLLNARSSLRRGVRYGCVVTRARRPYLGAVLELGLEPTDQAMYLLYRALYQACSAMPANRLPELDTTQQRALIQAYGQLPTRRDNDSIVPTLSQVFGTVVHATMADHHDVIGHFGDHANPSEHFEWLRTISDFRTPQFRALWSDTAAFMLDAA